MRYFLMILLTACAMALHAQNPPGRPALKTLSPWELSYQEPGATRDSNFVFDKHYYEAENHWVVFPKRPGVTAYKNMYLIGFIYFDAETGYTIIYHGLFNIDIWGQAYPDTVKSTRDFKWPLRVQLSFDGGFVAVVPDNVLSAIGLTKIPDWLPSYRHDHPDTIKTLEKRMRFGHLFTIYAKDASRHVGEDVTVKGMIYNGAIKPDPAKPGAKMALLYMGGGDYPNQKLTIVIKEMTNQNEEWLTKVIAAIKSGPKPQQQKGINASVFSAAGKIFLLDGKPAVQIKPMELGSITWMDSTPTVAQLQNYW